MRGEADTRIYAFPSGPGTSARADSLRTIRGKRGGGESVTSASRVCGMEAGRLRNNHKFCKKEPIKKGVRFSGALSPAVGLEIAIEENGGRLL